MTCLEAQSNIMAFIDKKLPDDKVNDFVRHIKSCPNCSEELEIYYTLIVGTRQLDNNEELSKDFNKDLYNELNKLSNKIRKVKRFKISTFGICCAALVIGFALFYSACLKKVYNIEQFIIKERQGDTYFYDYFGDYITLCDYEFEEEYNKEKKITEFENRETYLEFYIDIQQYNLTLNEGENENE